MADGAGVNHKRHQLERRGSSAFRPLWVKHLLEGIPAVNREMSLVGYSLNRLVIILVGQGLGVQVLGECEKRRAEGELKYFSGPTAPQNSPTQKPQQNAHHPHSLRNLQISLKFRNLLKN